MARKLEVEIVGDSRSLERAFARSTRSATKFNRGITSNFRKTARSFDLLRASLVSGGVALAIKDVVGAAAESQQVLGQTSVAVRSAGLSWRFYSKQIQDAVDAQSKLGGFDDEALLRTFNLFIRNSGDVDEALRRNRIAMDVARARFIDLEQAASLVNKAALGNAGALRRVGIDARKGASGVELLAQLEEQFGGAAKASTDDAATAMDRFNVQLENLKESGGEIALPVVTDLSKAFEGLTSNVKETNSFLRRHHLGFLQKGLLPSLRDVHAFGIDRTWGEAGTEAGRRVGQSFQIALREHLDQVNRTFDRDLGKGKARRGATVEQRNTWFDSMIGRREDRVQDIKSLKGQLAELGRIAQLIRDRMGVTKDPTRRLTLEDELVGVLRQQRQVQADIAQQAADANQAEKERLERIKAANQALKDRAEAIKSAVLDRLQRRQTDILNKRALREAQEQLRIARQTGGPVGIRLARQGLQDVRFDMLRARLEAAPAQLTRAGQFTLGNVITINVHGVTDPDAVARKVAAVLAKRRRRTTTQTRGPAAGTAAGAH